MNQALNLVLSRGIQAPQGGGIEEAVASRISQRKDSGLADTVLSGSKEDSQKALIQLAQRNPQMAKLTHGILQSNNQEAQLAYQQAINLTARRALKLQRMDRTQRDREVERMIAGTEPNSPEHQELIAFRGMTTEEQDFELQDDVDQAREIENILKARNPGSGNAKLAGSFLTKVNGVNTLQAGVVKDGQLEIQSRPLDGEMVARATGETADQTSTRKAVDARAVTSARQEAEIDAIPGRVAAKGAAEFHSGNVLAAVETVDALPTINRSLELLNSVDTGGFSAASIRAKQVFGFESGDEAELSNKLAKAVLSQLRDTFGAQFTEREGARLDRIEAGIGKSTEGNKRILKQLRSMMRRKLERGLESAVETKRFNEAQLIQDSLDGLRGDGFQDPLGIRQ